MREHVNGVVLPVNWRRYSLDKLTALADSLGVVYWVDGEALRTQLREAIRAELNAARATELRDAGTPWTKIAGELGYNNDGTAYSAVASYCKRAGREFPNPPLALRAPSRARGEKAYLMRLDGNRWREIAEAVGYREANGAYAAVKRYCDMMGLEFPQSFNLDGAPRKQWDARCLWV